MMQLLRDWGLYFYGGVPEVRGWCCQQSVVYFCGGMRKLGGGAASKVWCVFVGDVMEVRGWCCYQSVVCFCGVCARI